MGQPQLRVLPELLATVTSDADHAPGELGSLFQGATGATHRLVTWHDPNTVAASQNDLCGYVPASTGYEATSDISESDAGLFAGRLASSTTPTDNDFVFIQTGGKGTFTYNPTGDTAIDAGDGIVWDQDGIGDRNVAATNALAGKCETALSGLSTGVETTVEAFINGIV